MDFNQLKELARKMGGILVMNGDNPEFVIMPFEKYQKIETGKISSDGITQEEDTSAIEKLNKEISALKEEIRQKEEIELADDVGEDIEEEKGEEMAENNSETE